MKNIRVIRENNKIVAWGATRMSAERLEIEPVIQGV